MLDLPCKFAVVDVLDVLGTNRMNVSKNIEKVKRRLCIRALWVRTDGYLSIVGSGTWTNAGGNASSRAGTARSATLRTRTTTIWR